MWPFKRTPPHCTNCGLVKEKVTKQFGYTKSGKPVYRSKMACPRQNLMYVFDIPFMGSRDNTNCIYPDPWACPHEIEAYNNKLPWYGACPNRICPDRVKYDGF